jgi:hypothetical protein
MAKDLLTEEEADFIASVRNGERYFTGILMFTIMITLTVLDVMLLRRLKLFYPGFYYKEKNRVI